MIEIKWNPRFLYDFPTTICSDVWNKIDVEYFFNP